MRCTILVLALLGIASVATADLIYVAPEFVTAEGDGSFAFDVTLVAGQGCVGWTGYGYWGEENVAGGMWADTFCIDPQPIEPGALLTFEVSGQLVDPTRFGVVGSEAGFCTGGAGSAQTVVLAPAVANEDESWTALKAKFR